MSPTIPRHVSKVEPIWDDDFHARFEEPDGYVGLCSCGWRGYPMKLRVHAENEGFAHAEYWNTGILNG